MTTGNSVTTGYEAELWEMADALRGSMDAAEYKHVVLGLIFLKYVSDAFEETRAQLEAERDQGADPEHPDEYRAKNIFWIPTEARWARLQAQARQPTVGQTVDDAMEAIERENRVLEGVLPKDYALPSLDTRRLGQLIDVVSNTAVGDADARSRDVLGRVYEYFLSRFAAAEGRRAGEFYTPRRVVRLAFIDAHASGNGNGGSARADISIYGQESNYTTWRLAKMNLALRGIDGQIAHGDSFHNDRHADLRADYILANPPFNVSDWGGERLADDQRWQYGAPPVGNANFAWVQHFVHHLARGASPASCSPTARCPRTSRARARSASGSSSRTWSTAWWRCPASSSTRRRFRPASGSSPATAATGSSATAAARCCSSTPARWAA